MSIFNLMLIDINVECCVFIVKLSEISVKCCVFNVMLRVVFLLLR